MIYLKIYVESAFSVLKINVYVKMFLYDWWMSMHMTEWLETSLWQSTGMSTGTTGHDPVVLVYIGTNHKMNGRWRTLKSEYCAMCQFRKAAVA